MKRHTYFAAAVVMCLSAHQGQSAIILEVDGSSALGGTTQIFEGNLATFPVPGGTNRYSSVVTSGTDITATTQANPTTGPERDTYLNYGSAALDINGGTAGTGLTTSTYRFVQIFYSLGNDWTGSTHQLRLDTTNEGAAFDTFTNSNTIASTTGAHTLLIDLLSDDGTTLSGTWSGEWTVLRWDFFNDAGNGSKSFTIDKIEFGSEVVAIPEPSSSALVLGGLGLSMFLRRRK
ncbi:MAG: PEP-CTERM sorting domain-containing protein [Akkermansiaceae bacterium]